MTTAEEKASSACQVYPVCCITGEGRAEGLRAWGPGFEQEGAGGARVGGGGGRRGNSIYVRQGRCSTPS